MPTATVTRPVLFGRVKKIIVERLGVPEEKVTPEALLVDDLNADSLDTIELVMAFEEEFKIEIFDDTAEKVKTVNDAVETVATLMAAAAP